MSKWAFNEKTKVLIAGNPDHTIVNPKYGVKYSCRRFCGTVLTTNNLASGIEHPEQDDRRYDVMDTASLKEMELEDAGKRRTYFETLYGWFYAGGDRHVAAFLHKRDLSRFSLPIMDSEKRRPIAWWWRRGPHKTSGSWTLLKNSATLMSSARIGLPIVRSCVGSNFLLYYSSRLPHAMGRAGYMKYRNPLAPKNLGRWQFEGKSYTVYIRTTALLFHRRRS